MGEQFFFNSFENFSNHGNNFSEKTQLRQGQGFWAPIAFQIPADIAIIVTNAFAVVILSRTNLIPYPVRMLTVNLLISDCICALFFLSDAFTKNFFKEPHPFVVVLNYGSIKCCRFISGIVVATLSVERLLVLVNWDAHIKLLNEQKLRTTILLIWILGISCSLLIDSVFLKSGWLNHPCGKKCYSTSIITKDGVKCRAVILALFSAVTIVCFLKILNIARRSLNHVSTEGSMHLKMITKSAVTSALIIAAAMIGNIPGIMTSLLQTFTSIRFGSGIQVFLVACMHVSCLLNPYVYVWRFKDARLQVLLFFSCIAGCRGRAEKLRYDVFDIVKTPDKTTKSRV